MAHTMFTLIPDLPAPFVWPPPATPSHNSPSLRSPPLKTPTPETSKRDSRTLSSLSFTFTPSTTRVEDPRNRRPSVDDPCRVCAAPGDGRHFGVMTCRACIEFFRYSIKKHTTFVCRPSDPSTPCVMRKVPGNNYCAKCRWDKCEEVGMQVGMIRKARIPSRGPATPKTATCTSTRKRKQSTAIPTKTTRTSTSKQSTRSLAHDEALPSTSNFASLPPSASTAPPSATMPSAAISTTVTSVPSAYPTLMNLVYGYNRLQQLRDQRFDRRLSLDGMPTPRYIMTSATSIDLQQFKQQIVSDFEPTFEYLKIFPAFCDLSSDDRDALFGGFWQHFVVLERCFYTFSNLYDPHGSHLLLSDGAVVSPSQSCMPELHAKNSYENSTNGIDTSDAQCDAIPAGSTLGTAVPWIKLMVDKLLPQVKMLRPMPAEMAFAFASLFYSGVDRLGMDRLGMVARVTSEETMPFAAEARACMQSMNVTLRREIIAYYNAEKTDVDIYARVEALSCILTCVKDIVKTSK